MDVEHEGMEVQQPASAEAEPAAAPNASDVPTACADARAAVRTGHSMGPDRLEASMAAKAVLKMVLGVVSAAAVAAAAAAVLLWVAADAVACRP